MKIKIIVGALIGGLIGALSMGAVFGQEKTVIRFIGMKQAGLTTAEMDAIAARFGELNPNIKVDTTYVSYDALHDKQATILAAKGKTLDLVNVDDIWVAGFASAGWLWDITNKITSEMKDEIFPASWYITTYNGKVWGMPWLLDEKYFFYNKVMLKKAGIANPPRTWKEFNEQSLKIKNAGLVDYPSIWCWSQHECAICDFVTLLYGFGGEFVDKDLNPIFNDMHGIEALTWMVDSIKKGISNPASTVSVEEDVRHTFSMGKAAFAINWIYMYDLANDPKESKVAGQVGMALMPVSRTVLAKGIPSATNNGSMGYSISAYSNHKEAAWKYLKYFTSKKVQKKYSAHQLPIWKSLFEDPELLASYPITVPMFVKQFPYSHVRPKVPYYMELSRILQVAIQNALTGKKKPKQALDEAVKEIKKIQY